MDPQGVTSRPSRSLTGGTWIDTGHSAAEQADVIAHYRVYEAAVEFVDEATEDAANCRGEGGATER